MAGLPTKVTSGVVCHLGTEVLPLVLILYGWDF